MKAQPIRVLHFYKTAMPDTVGGIECFIDELAHNSLAYNIRPTVLSLSRNIKENPCCDSGYTHYRAKCHFQIRSTDFSFSALRLFKKLANQADIIHYHYPWPFMDLMHCLTGIKKPTIVTYHSDVIRQKYLYWFYKPLESIFLKKVTKIIATSPNYLASSRVLQQHKSKVDVIPVGLDPSRYPRPTQTRLDVWKHKFGDKFFLFIGVLRYYKGLHCLIEAAKTARYPIVIVGSGGLEHRLKKQVSSLGLSNIHFTGQLSDDDKTALLTLCFAFVFPSHLRSEAFGVSLLEGAMFGKPMISCELGTGTTYINIHNETGLVVQPNNASDLSHAMQYLWENPDQAALMGKNAAQRFLSLFQSKYMFERYAEQYKSLSGKA